MKIASWNVARNLSSVEKFPSVVEGIKRLDADEIILPEAFDPSGEPVDLEFAEQLGYVPFFTEYQDKEPHPSGRQYILALSRTAANSEVIRLGSRNALHIATSIENEPVHITGAHFDDRDEKIRMDMALSFMKQPSNAAPNVLLGDLNSMHGDDMVARILSNDMTRKVASIIPNSRARSLATRFTDMASGYTIGALEGGGYEDADPRHRPTMLMGGFAVAQLDHMMYNKFLRVEDFQAKKFKGSDHKAITGQLHLA